MANLREEMRALGLDIHQLSEFNRDFEKQEVLVHIKTRRRLAEVVRFPAKLPAATTDCTKKRRRRRKVGELIKL
ncbi:hypothetical protein Nepgr_032851 [Nepenthes gracilis]|uniref:Uncharacterized protein n=1 Tax=Nepenthes gracilis TaxID=150966 RepID=A0AAD3TJF0_NEPGR|nr:hypothetical protein Nepgr_032851 [Nepenthes gracilis]